ncbi:MAG: cation:proton antiporter [Bacteroidales bacterium]|nr:cation:proton antiporter [Bacteroidales bacterium]
MEENLNLVADLALILISAGIITVIFRWLKQPLILGYLVAGFLVGPHFGLFPDVTSVHTVEQWAEIGIIFLLFSLGLEFSFKKLLKVGSSALITSMTVFIGMLVVGMTVGKAMGWTTMESIFLGGMISMSSTTIIIKSFEDLGLKKKPFANIVFGTLIIEDLLAILLMVLLSTLAVSKQFSGEEMVGSILRLIFFMVLWFTVGIFLIPIAMRKAKSFLNDETLLVLAIGLCFGMVIFANALGFSSALGAFVMGSILAETLQGEKIEKMIENIKNLFGAIFFVSVGMMVDPQIIVQYWKPVLLFTLIVTFGKPILATLGVLISGRPLKTSISAGMSLAQIGEFAFILASLGASLGVMREFIYPIMVAVSVITTFITPYFMKLSEPFSEWLENHIPPKVMTFLNQYSASSQRVSNKSEWNKLLRVVIVRIVVYTILAIAINIGVYKLVYPLLLDNVTHLSELAVKWISTILTILCMFPFLYGLAINRGKVSETFEKLWYDKRSNRGILVAIILFRVFLSIALCVSVFFNYFPFSYWVIFAGVIAFVLFILISRSDIVRFEKMENLFLSNLNEKDNLERKKRPITTSLKDKMPDYNINIDKIVVSPNAPFIGQSLMEIPFHQEFGVNIVKIIRGNKIITLPSSQERIYPSDILYAIGTEEQMTRFVDSMDYYTGEELPEDDLDVVVTSILLSEKSQLANRKIAQSEVRNYGCMIIGVERGEDSVMNPPADFTMLPDDIIWLVGDKKNLDKIIEIN